jgi:hypothetical protein
MKRSLLCLIAFFLSGCQISSRVAMQGQGGREAYNITLQKTTNEQMLLNLVRLRYVDFPFFLDVSNITTQCSYSTKIKPVFPIPGFTSDNPAEIGAEASWQNTPTITYTPLEGPDFASQLFYPIDLLTIAQLIYAGWDVDRVLRVCVQSIYDIPNAPTTSAPLPDGVIPEFERFMELTQLFRYFQIRSKLQIGVSVDKTSQSFIGKSLQFGFPSEGVEATKLRDMIPDTDERIEGKYCLVDLALGFNKRIESGILPRSLLACMYYLSLGVDIPKAHELSHRISCSCSSEGKVFDWRDVVGDLIQVHSSKTVPENAYVSVRYKGHWFYISESDVESKRTFVLLLQLYNLQSAPVKPSGPVLTLPLK